jgi:hypothetical protein
MIFSLGRLEMLRDHGSRVDFTLIGHGAVFIHVTAASLVPRDAFSGETAPFSVEDPGYAVD